MAGDPRGAKKPVWPFYVALSLFRGAAILAGVRARVGDGKRVRGERGGGGFVGGDVGGEGARRGGRARGFHSPPRRFRRRRRRQREYGNDVGLTFVRGMEPSERAASLLVKLRAFMSDHVYPAEPILEAHAASERTLGGASEGRGAQGAGESGGALEPVAAPRLGSVAEDRAEGRGGRIGVDAWMRGPGLTNLEYAHLAGCMGASVWASEFFNCSAPDTGNMEVLLRYGTKEQQERWLRPLLLGKIRSCFAMTEPAVASSDATNVTSSIVRRGDSYVDQRSKVVDQRRVRSPVRAGDFHGKDDTGRHPGVPKHRQQTMVLVPMRTKGVTVVRPLPVFGYDDAPHGHAETTFEDVVVSAKDAELLGEGRGFEIAQGRLGPGRLHHCMRLIGMGERALTLAARRAEAEWPSDR